MYAKHKNLEKFSWHRVVTKEMSAEGTWTMWWLRGILAAGFHIGMWGSRWPNTWSTYTHWQWTQADRQWTLGDRHWTLGDRQWTLGDRQWTLADRQWTLGDRQWTLGDRQWIGKPSLTDLLWIAVNLESNYHNTFFTRTLYFMALNVRTYCLLFVLALENST